MSRPFKMRSGNTTPFKEMGSSPAKFSWKRGAKGFLRGGIAGFFKGGNTERQGFQGTLVTGNVESSHDDYEAENEVANLDEQQKDEILKDVVKKKKESEASGDTQAATVDQGLTS